MNGPFRSQFPLLQRTLEGRPITYLDSAATALKPQRVLDAERRYGTDLGANIHRGKHALSEEASTAFEDARRHVARFLNAEPGEIVFVKSTTEGLNLVASGLGLTRGDRVVAAAGEHHSNLVPWMRQASVRAILADPLQPLNPDEVRTVLREARTRVLAVQACSNVTGIVQPVAELCRQAREEGALSVVDAAQAAPHFPIDVKAMGCDFLAFSGHKVMGPTGIGVLFGRAELLEGLNPLIVGGGAVDRVTAEGYTLKQVPHRFEAGTAHISGVLGLSAALAFLEALTYDQVAAHERTLAATLARGLSEVPKARVLMAADPQLGLASIVPLASGVTADQLALILSDSGGFMVRSGYHCAHPLFDVLGIPAALRVSAYLYNTVEEVENFTRALAQLLRRFGGR